jgi:hypothetical protein
MNKKSFPKPNPDGITLSAVELHNLRCLVDHKIQRMKRRRLWYKTVGKNVDVERMLGHWKEILEKLQ